VIGLVKRTSCLLARRSDGVTDRSVPKRSLIESRQCNGNICHVPKSEREQSSMKMQPGKHKNQFQASPFPGGKVWGSSLFLCPVGGPAFVNTWYLYLPICIVCREHLMRN